MSRLCSADSRPRNFGHHALCPTTQLDPCPTIAPNSDSTFSQHGHLCNMHGHSERRSQSYQLAMFRVTAFRFGAPTQSKAKGQVRTSKSHFAIHHLSECEYECRLAELRKREPRRGRFYRILSGRFGHLGPADWSQLRFTAEIQLIENHI